MPHVISMMLIAFSRTQAGQNVEHSHGQVKRHNLPSVVQILIDLNAKVKSQGTSVECTMTCISSAGVDLGKGIKLLTGCRLRRELEDRLSCDVGDDEEPRLQVPE